MADLNREINWLLEDKYQGKKTEGFFADCKALSLGTPLAYLIGWTPFINCKIWLDNRPLIPRPETEFWTEEAITIIRDGQTYTLDNKIESIKVLDLCAGSGCIGIAVAKNIAGVQVDFGEINKELLPTIEKNIAENLSSDNNYNLVQTNVFSNIRDKYNFILTNPPYINESLNRTEESVVSNEPYLALFGGEDGMEIITKIITDAPQHLAIGGQLWMEHEPEQSEAINNLAKDNGFTVSNHTDQFGVERYSILVLQ